MSRKPSRSSELTGSSNQLTADFRQSVNQQIRCGFRHFPPPPCAYSFGKLTEVRSNEHRRKTVECGEIVCGACHDQICLGRMLCNHGESTVAMAPSLRVFIARYQIRVASANPDSRSVDSRHMNWLSGGILAERGARNGRLAEQAL